MTTATESREGGFTLIEILVSLAVTLILLLAVLAVVERSGRVSRLETESAAMHQSERASHRVLARDLRMAGRGGLPSTLPGRPAHQNPALDLRNDVGNGGVSAEIAPGRTDSPTAVVGTDVLAVRGVFETPLYQVTPGTAAFSLAADRTGGTIRVRDLNPAGQPQDLAPLAAAIDNDLAHALILRSPLGIYTVVELVPGGSSHSANEAVLAFRTAGSTLAAAYGGLTTTPGTVPTGLETVASVGILEELRFYVRDAQPPVLSLAAVYPNSNVPVGDDDANLRLDVADGVLDLQIALGFDSTLGGGSFDQDLDNDGADDQVVETADGANDDWLFNGAGDDVTAAPWNGSGPPPDLFYVRVSTVARTATREFRYQDRPIGDVEDHAYGEASAPATEAERIERLYRRSLRTSLIDLRNL